MVNFCENNDLCGALFGARLESTSDRPFEYHRHRRPSLPQVFLRAEAKAEISLCPVFEPSHSNWHRPWFYWRCKGGDDSCTPLARRAARPRAISPTSWSGSMYPFNYSRSIPMVFKYVEPCSSKAMNNFFKLILFLPTTPCFGNPIHR